MTRVLALAGSALFGAAFAVALVVAAARLGPTIHFAAPAGEADFAFRLNAFLLGVLPGFALLGVWTAYSSRGSWRRWMMTWAGAAGGSIVAYGATIALKGCIESLPDGTPPVLGMFGLWLLLAGAGVLLMSGRRSKVATPAHG